MGPGAANTPLSPMVRRYNKDVDSIFAMLKIAR